MYKIKAKKLISSILAILMLTTSLAIGCVANADDAGVAINDTNFTDKTFRNIVSDYYDLDGNGYLSTSELSKTVISLSGYLDTGESIENLKGIEFFTKVQKLYIGGIGLKEMDLSSNTELTQIRCGGNDLTDIDLTGLTKLTYLDCSVNNLTSLDVSPCASLQTLQCYTNSIASLDLTNNTSLTTLYAHQNELTTLDLSKNTNLVNLYCASNHIKELDLSANTSLSDITSEMIGDQWLNEEAVIFQGKIYIYESFKSASKLVSSSLDTKQETDEGEETVSAYSSNAFVTTEVTYFANKLTTPDGDVVDGFTYKYDVGNSSCQNMTVNIELTRNFYQVNFYLDETKAYRLSFSLVQKGNPATAPTVPEAAQCKKFVSWSGDYSAVTQDEDIYIVWADDHNIVKTIDDETGDVDIHCTKCDNKTIQFNFPTVYNTKTGDTDFDANADFNSDGVINAKDYAILLKM